MKNLAAVFCLLSIFLSAHSAMAERLPKVCEGMTIKFKFPSEATGEIYLNLMRDQIQGLGAREVTIEGGLSLNSYEAKMGILLLSSKALPPPKYFCVQQLSKMIHNFSFETFQTYRSNIFAASSDQLDAGQIEVFWSNKNLLPVK